MYIVTRGPSIKQQETERDELIQAKHRELAQAEQQLRQLKQQVRLVTVHAKFYYCYFICVIKH